MLPPRVRKVAVLPPTRLRVEYVDGQIRIFDVAPLLERGRFRELRDPALFATVRPDLDTIAWSNGLDLDPEDLYDDSLPEPRLPT